VADIMAEEDHPEDLSVGEDPDKTIGARRVVPVR